MAFAISYPFASNRGEPKPSFVARCGNYGRTKYNPSGCHMAADFPAPRGTAVLAPVSGEIVRNAWDDYLGWHVVIRNSFGDFYVCHFENRSNRKVGEKVSRQRTRVGTNGDSGNASGPHVHLTWYLGRQVGKAWGSVPFGDPYPFAHANWAERFAR